MSEERKERGDGLSGTVVERLAADGALARELDMSPERLDATRRAAVACLARRRAEAHASERDGWSRFGGALALRLAWGAVAVGVLAVGWLGLRGEIGSTGGPPPETEIVPVLDFQGDASIERRAARLDARLAAFRNLHGARSTGSASGDRFRRVQIDILVRQAALRRELASIQGGDT